MVTFSESFKAFLYDESRKGSAIARLIIKAIPDPHSWDIYHPIYEKILTTSEVNYITMRPDGLLSYLPAGKEHKVNERGEWAREGRQSGKPAKVIRKVFNPKILRLIPNKDFEMFGNAYKAKFMDNGFEFRILANTEIPSVYCMTRADGEASLNGSCMNNDAAYLEIYKHIKELSILILTNKEGKLCGRALIWNLKSNEYGPITFMDRIYVVEDYMYDLFISHAVAQGYWRKSFPRTFEYKSDWVDPNTDDTKQMFFRIDTNTEFRYYPYIDTFSYGADGWLSNREEDTYYTYNCTDGTREGDDDEEEDECEEEDDHSGEVYDEVDDRYIDQDDGVFLGNLGDRGYRNVMTHRDNCVQAYVRGYRQEWFHQEDSHVVEVNEEWYHTDHDKIQRCADGDYYLADECVICETDNEYYHESSPDLLEGEDGLYYHKKDDHRVVWASFDPTRTVSRRGYSGRYILLDDHRDKVVQDVDGNWVFRNHTAKNWHIVDYLTYDNTLEQVLVPSTTLVKWGRRKFYFTDRRLRAMICKTPSPIIQPAYTHE